MPLNGLHPFLPLLNQQYKWLKDVSMPLNGLHPFLQICSEKLPYVILCVNALKRASSISTFDIPKNTQDYNMWCVNALKRASSISTIPEG